MSAENITSEKAYRAGRLYARDHDLPPCGDWLRKEGYRYSLGRHHFLVGFRHEKATDPLAGSYPHMGFECRCDEGSDDELPYPYYGA
jgi:hypothetical protein